MANPLIPETRNSLIDALKGAGAGDPTVWQQAWTEFFTLYYPVILAWFRRRAPDKADDLTQEMLLQLVRKIGTYDRHRGTKFRSWLKTVVRHAAINAYRKDLHAVHLERADVDRLEDEAVQSLEEEIEKVEELSPKLAEALERVRARVKPHNWKAFWEVKVEGRPVTAVAGELGLGVQAVYVAIKRIGLMLQEEMGVAPAPLAEPEP